MTELWPPPVEGAYCQIAAPIGSPLDVKQIPRKFRRSMGRDSVLTFLAVKEAVAMAGIPDEMYASSRLGITVGSTATSAASLEDYFRAYLVDKNVRQVPANGFFRVMGHSCAANIANALGVTGRVHATPAACASGLIALGMGYELICAGIQDIMICGGTEELHPTAVATFDIVGASSMHCNEHPERAPAPFDKDRDGTVCGEGAGVVVLENEEHARSRGARPLAAVRGFASTCDGESMAQPGIDSISQCLTATLADAGVQPDEIDYINAHATGTVHGDVAEARALASIFPEHIPVSGLKGYLGHTLGASGAIESIATLEMMRGGYVIPTAKLHTLDPACAGINHITTMQERRISMALKCSFGFGGVNGTMIFGRMEDG